jgi:hypothetical protein
MRKKTINNLFDYVLWYLVYLLPLIVWLIILARNNFNADYTLGYVFSNCGLGIVTNNPITTALFDLFGTGADAVLPLFSSPDIIYFFTWFAGCVIAHLLVDFLLFIPRLAHKWMHGFIKDDD